MKNRPYLFNLILLALAMLFSVAVGPVFISPDAIGRTLLNGLHLTATAAPVSLDVYTTIIFQIRLPHMLLMTLAGAALGGSGAVYQGLFRNPLADPYLIGVASGAGLGAVAAMALKGQTGLLGLYAVPAAAFCGAILTVAVVVSLARSNGAGSTTGLVLAGVAVSAFANALTSYLMLRSNDEMRRAMAWLMGGSSASGWEPVLVTLPYVLISVTALLVSGHMLNVLQFGDEQAHQLGISVRRARLFLIVAASLATAGAVAFAGIIGFVGLIVPHTMRLLWGPDYRRLTALSVIGGGSALLLADMLARIVLSPEVLPVGIVTALAGAPFFLWILRRNRTVEVF
jgi:iron complex transport system permease protein